MPFSSDEILQSLVRWRLLPDREEAVWRARLRQDQRLRRGERLMRELVRARKLTRFQARAIYRGEGAHLFVADYVLCERLGVGAMGQVFKAYHRGKRRWAGLKVLREEWTQSPRHVERFQREVHAASALRHPNIVRTFDAGCAAGVHYLAMEYVDGPNLDRHLRDSGPLPVDLAVRAALQAARGLAYAHRRGVVHRDVKPSNLLLAPGGAVKILDMGIARCLTPDEEPAERLTHSGQILGTPHYMAPEQAVDPRNVSPQADIYALGCTLYRMLTGETPYTAESDYEVLIAHLRSPIPRLAAKRGDVPEMLDEVCRQMMAKTPEERYFSMEDVISELELAQTTAPAGQAAVSTLSVAAAGEDTVTAVGRPPLLGIPRARWRVPDPGPALTAHLAAPPLPSTPAHAECTTHNALRMLSDPQRDQLRDIYAVSARRAAPRRRPKRRRTFQNAAIIGVSAALTGALLFGASRMTPVGQVALEVYPAQAVIEVVDQAQKVELRRLADEPFSFRAAPGHYRIKVTKAGFLPYVRDFVLESGGRLKIYAALRQE